MEILTPADIWLVKATALGALAYGAQSMTSRYLRKDFIKPELPLLSAAQSTKPSTIQPTRSILKQLEQNNKACMIFYGSQTGTAERYAHRFAREALEKYALGCVVADLDSYDFGDLLKLSEKHLMVFILATYGEGEPTDNAISFQNFLNRDMAVADLQHLRYSAFGLGSSSYTHFNAMVRRVDETMMSRNAQRIGEVGMGDDGKNTLDEDFTLWLDATLPHIASSFNLTPIPYVYKPTFKVTEISHEKVDSKHIFLGEPNKAHLYGRIQGPFTSQNPFPASIVQARELFTGGNRSCLHIELDVSGTSITYDTGDHLAVWPVNSDCQVNLFLEMFGLSSRRDQAIEIHPTDVSNRVPIPTKTTYEAAVRHYLDICAPISRRDLRKLSQFATSRQIRDEMLQLAGDMSRFTSEVTSRQLTISQLLFQFATAADEASAINAPFSFILELIPKLRLRHYSISSSSLISRKQISITAVIDTRENTTNQISFRGVSTGYLSALKAALSKNVVGKGEPTHSLHSSRHSHNDPSTISPKPLIYVRRSKFRPPFDPSTPVIMIGPGTGVAPFRAFIHERAHQYSLGRRIGRTILFYGCRSSQQDYLYQDEWWDLIEGNKLGEGVFSVYTAFSREGNGQPKQYVQDLISENERAEEIRGLVRDQGARIYICGNAARMAKDVARVLGGVLETDECNGVEVVAGLKKEGRWCEDVW